MSADEHGSVRVIGGGIWPVCSWDRLVKIVQQDSGQLSTYDLDIRNLYTVALAHKKLLMVLPTCGLIPAQKSGILTHLHSERPKEA